MLTNETMDLLGDGPIVETNKDGRNVPELEQFHSVLLFTKQHTVIYLCSTQCLWSVPFYLTNSINTIQKTTDSIFDYIEIWFTDQDNNSLQIEDE